MVPVAGPEDPGKDRSCRLEGERGNLVSLWGRNQLFWLRSSSEKAGWRSWSRPQVATGRGNTIGGKKTDKRFRTAAENCAASIAARRHHRVGISSEPRVQSD